MTTPHPRRHAFDGVENFRDFGDYAGAGGRRMHKGRFFRSAHHARATDDDLTRIADFGISAVIDLRRPEERSREPSKRWRNFAAPVIENDIEYEGELSWHDHMRASDMSPGAFRAYLEQYYANGPYVERHIDLFRRYFHTLASSDGPILVHCAGGKDRTGMIVAFTHTLAGVHRDDIYEDFLLTNDPSRVEKFGPIWAASIEAEYGKRPSHEAMTIAMGVEAHYLDAAFAVIAERHGDVETYVRDVLGIDAQQRAAIERRLFE